ncbi:MAG: hypothetical protein KG028_09625 [Actinobacteria bacterium]|jgi:hypothetical protein|nr:hypothetical protein [Actinomycetota bacterium]
MPDEITRNAFDQSGDDEGEMTRRPRLDDRTADAVFSGRLPADREDLADVAALAETLRAAASATPAPVPTASLNAMLQDGLSIENGDLPVTVGSNAAAPATQGARLPNWRRKSMLLEMIIAKVAGISLLAKTGVAAAAITAGATGVAVTGNLPAPAQDAFDRAFVQSEDDETEAPTDEATEADAEAVDTEAVDTEVVDETLVSEEPDTETEDAEDAGRPEVPGAEGRANADENAGENGAHGRATADDAATGGRDFGQQRAEEGKQRGEEASKAGRDRAANAPDDGAEEPEAEEPEESDAEESDEASAQQQPEGKPAGSAATGEEKSSSARDKAADRRP